MMVVRHQPWTGHVSEGTVLDATGRKAYRQGLKSILTELLRLAGKCGDAGRLGTFDVIPGFYA